MVEVYYTEQQDTRSKQVELQKELRGGAKVAVGDAKKAMSKAIDSGFDKACCYSDAKM